MKIPARWVLVFLAVTWTEAFGRGTAFPQNSYMVSPDGRWQISCLSKRLADGWAEHTLVVAPNRSEEAKPFYVTGRWCEVLWNGANEVVALTDWAGSNVASVFIIDVRHPEQRRELSEIVPGISTPLAKEECEGHIYWEALEWKGADILSVQVFGHTDEAHGHAFCYTFSVNLAFRTWTMVTKDVTDGAEDRAWEGKENRMEKAASDPAAIAQDRQSLFDSALASKAEEAIRSELEAGAMTEEIEARRYVRGDIDGDGKDDLLVVTSFTNGGSTAWSHDFVLIRSSQPDCPIIRNFGGKKVRSYRKIYMGQAGIIVDFLYYAESDPVCCPSVERKGYFALFGDSLWEVASLEGKSKAIDRAQAPDGKYVVRAGDTGAAIARRFGLTLAELCAANPGVRWDRLHVGELVRVAATKP